jgi:succinate-acetate transporter protein
MTALEAVGVEAERVPAVVEIKGPIGVVVGAGGNPIVLGLACFAVAATCLGMVLIGVVPLTALAIIVPIIAGATGFFQIIATVWAVVLGQTFVAVVFGLFSGFWWSLTMLLIGLGHNWYGIAVADVAHSECLFFIAWTVMFFFLLVPSLRLPAVYPAIVADVVITLIVVTLAVWNASANSFKLGGWVLLAGAALGFVGFLNNASVSLGGPPSPSLGPPIIK